MDEPCMVNGCTAPVRWTGLCSMHYTRKIRHGDPNVTKQIHPRFSDDLTTRLNQFRDMSGGPDACWPYKGDISTSIGYGSIMYRREDDGAHRWAWREANGRDVPAGMLVRHKCDNPPCMNPAHLELGTPMDNARDRQERGRMPDLKGERAGRARLTWDQVREIRAMCANGVPRRQIAERFGVSTSHIYSIKVGKTWSEAA